VPIQVADTGDSVISSWIRSCVLLRLGSRFAGMTKVWCHTEKEAVHQPTKEWCTNRMSQKTTS
jgi:hypothetical protein